jgi:hypothetical protein
MTIGYNTWNAIRGALVRFRFSGRCLEYSELTFIDYKDDYEHPDGNNHVSFEIYFDVCATMELWEAQHYIEFLNMLISIANILNVCNIAVDCGEPGIDNTEINSVMSQITQILHTGNTREIRQAIKELSL